MKSCSQPERRVKPVVKGLAELANTSAVTMVQGDKRHEIERAITNAKRTAWDKSFRREWYRAAARRRFAFSQANRRLSGEQRCVHEKSKLAARDSNRVDQRTQVPRGVRPKGVQMCPRHLPP